MSDLLKGDVFRQFVVVEVPGVIALSPWALAVTKHYEEVSGFVSANPGASVLVALAFTTALGLLLEDLGARIESLWDERLGTQHKETWWTYLRTPRDEALPGVSYLRTVLMRVKFELSTVPALLLSLGGMWVCHSSEGLFGLLTMGIASSIHVVLVIYLLKESYDGVELLGRIREELLHAVD